MISAILFDMDGVLIDSEEYICKAAIEYFASLGVTVASEDFIPFVGAGENRYLGGVAEQYGVTLDIEQAKLDTYEIYGRLITGEKEALHGVKEFIEYAHRANLKMAIATSADKKKMEINLEVMGLDPSWFGALINGKDVERKKPFADIYLLAAKSLGVEIEKCVVFEDATNGVEAAKRAQALCGGITTSFSSEELLASGADFIINGLIDFEEFSTIEEFNRQLLRFRAREAALKAQTNAYAPYSNFRVGAAVVSKTTNQIYSGCNVENSSFGATICAERAALLRGITEEGDFTIDMVVVVSDDDPPAPPCALCLQVFAEFAHEKSEIYLYNNKGESRAFTFKELLPHPFIFPSQREKR